MTHDTDPREPKSKSQRKREHQALQLLARDLSLLPASGLARLPLSEALREQLALARGLQRGARQRQLKYLGRLLEAEDPAAIRAALQALERPLPGGARSA